MRIDARVVRVAMFSTVAYTAVQTNVALNAYRDSTIVPQYMTLLGIICPSPFFLLTLGLCINKGLTPTARYTSCIFCETVVNHGA